MTDELKTLLKIEGDASGAKKAAEETKAATAQMGQAAATTGQATTQVTEKTTQALDQKTTKTKEAKSGFEKLAQSMGVSTKEAQQFREAVSRISPEMAGLLDIAMKGEGAFKTLFTGIGAATVAALAAVQGISWALNEAAASAAKSRAEMERIKALSDESRSRRSTQIEDLSETLAKAGKVSDAATGKARAIETRMTGEGFKKEAVRAVMPFAVDESGQQVMSNDEIANLAAMEEFDPGSLAFKSPKEMQRVLSKARGKAGKQSDLVGKWRTAIGRRRERQTVGIQQMETGAMAKELTEGSEAVPTDQVKEAVEDIKSVVTTGRVQDENLGAHDMFFSGKDRAIWERRQRYAARRAQQMGLLDNQSAIEAGEMTGAGNMLAIAAEEADDIAGPVTRPIRAAIRGANAAVDRTVNNIVNNFNHGIIMQGRDTRNVQIPRVTNP